uniref:BZIP domain-containing protein n=1 Tax=Globisporangium ultimum (strain ATCC 200006 / CBS 805.95 / DAOM BR144) TaxID=431595 RepID=K3WNP8_GLOUD
MFAPFEAGGGFAMSSSDDEMKGKHVMDPQTAILERRRRQRDLKRKSRERRKNDVESMKEEVRQLEAKYEKLYIAKMSKPAQVTAQDTSSDLSIQEKYTQAREELQVLRSQIATMKERIVDFDRFSSAMESYLTEIAPPPGDMPLLRDQPDPFPKLSEEMVYKIIQECYQHIFHPQYKGKRISTGAQILGWRDERFVDGTTLQFSLKKSFKYLSMEQMMRKTWDIVTTDEHKHTIQRTTIGVKTLQVINDDVIVTQRCVHHPQLQKVTCVNLLMFRLRTEKGYVVAYKAINQPTTVNQADHSPTMYIDIENYLNERRDASNRDADAKTPDVTWVDMMQWFIFEEVPNDINPDDVDDDLAGFAASIGDATVPFYLEPFKVNVEFGGRLNNKDLHYISFFLIEVVSMIVRWDQAVACSRLTFSIDDTDPSTSSSVSAVPVSRDTSQDYPFF